MDISKCLFVVFILVMLFRGIVILCGVKSDRAIVTTVRSIGNAGTEIKL